MFFPQHVHDAQDNSLELSRDKYICFWIKKFAESWNLYPSGHLNEILTVVVQLSA
jgi:hypothetical protein